MEDAMKEHNIKLTSAETGVLWSSYMTESATIPVLTYFCKVVEDSEIKPLLEMALAKTTEHLTSLTKVFEQIESIEEERKKRISTAKLNHFVEKIVEQHKPTGTKRIHPKLFYVTQVDSKPTHFVFFVNKKKYFHFSYLRYLENKMREQFGFTGTPIVLGFKEKEKRYA